MKDEFLKMKERFLRIKNVLLHMKRLVIEMPESVSVYKPFGCLIVELLDCFSKKTGQIFASDQKNIYIFVVHNKKDKTMGKTTDIPPDNPMRLINRTGGVA